MFLIRDSRNAHTTELREYALADPLFGRFWIPDSHQIGQRKPPSERTAGLRGRRATQCTGLLGNTRCEEQPEKRWSDARTPNAVALNDGRRTAWSFASGDLHRSGGPRGNPAVDGEMNSRKRGSLFHRIEAFAGAIEGHRFVRHILLIQKTLCEDKRRLSRSKGPAVAVI